MKTIFTSSLLILFLFLSSFVSAQALYTKSGPPDPTWQYIVANQLIPANTASTAGIIGSKIDVNQAHTAIASSPYANRAIHAISIHTVGNSSIPRADFAKWSRWYQEDENTQVFRMFKGEINVSNDVYYKPRIEAELDNHSKGTSIINNAEWVEWSGTYTIVQPVESNIFQIWSNDDYVLMLAMKNDGKIQVNPRDGSGFRTISENATGKSFDLRVRDYGNKYEVFVNNEYFYGRSYTAAYGSSRAAHFRWGIYASRLSGDHSGVPQDGIMFVTGAQRIFSGDNPPPPPPPVDTDGDGIADNLDNCPTTANANQADEDNDKIGDVCDANLSDKDNDGIKDSVDNCPDVANPLQEDDNKNGIGNVCETTHYKYPGKAYKIPGIIEIPYFDLGGQNNAFYDNPSSTSTKFVSPRTAAASPEEVEVDAGGIGAIRNGEWVKYTVDSIKSGIYTIKISSASALQFVNYVIYLNDVELATVYAPTTNGWDIIQEFSTPNVKIESELTNAVLKVMFVNTTVTTRDLCNFKAFSFEKTGEISISGTSKINADKSFSISPNPARNVFSINTTGLIAKQISIKNAVGMEVLSQAIVSPVNNKYVVNNNLKTGIYFVFISDTNNKTHFEKLIIQ